MPCSSAWKRPGSAHPLERDLIFLDPLRVGLARSQLPLDLFVRNDTAGDGVDQEHLSRLQPSLLAHIARGNIDDTRLRRQHHDIVVGHHIAPRPQAIAVEHRADHPAIGKGHRRRAVPRLHQRRVIFVKGATIGIDMRIA